MILHYLRISWRNLCKYKAQTAISICAMAASLTLLAIVASLALSVRQIPLVLKPYADRTFELQFVDSKNIYAGDEDMSVISGHQFKSAEAVHHMEEGYGIPVNITVNLGKANEIEYTGDVFLADREYLNFQGMKSVYSGKVIDPISDDETVLTEKMARRLFGNENPIGKTIRIHTKFYGNKVPEKKYTVSDVMENPSPNNEFFQVPNSIFISSNQFFPNCNYQCNFILREGESPENLKEELAALLGNRKIQLLNMKELYSSRAVMALRNGIILFLILFALVSYSNYLKQQLQLFRIREREVSLRTCVGGSHKSILLLFSLEVLTVLILTLILTLILISVISNYLISHYAMLFESRNYSLEHAMSLAFISAGVLVLASMVAVALTIIRIRRNQTGLAFRMKPQPKHRLRNVGLTIQLAVCMVFTCVSIMFILSATNIKEYFGIPDDTGRYRKSILVAVYGANGDKADRVYERLESLNSYADIYTFNSIRRLFSFDEDKEKSDQKGINVVVQEDNDAIEFFGLKSETINDKVNPDKHVLISRTFKDKMIQKNVWNGKTLSIPYLGEYEIKGIYDYLPFNKYDLRDGVILHDIDNPINNLYHKVIVPKDGMDAKVNQEINNIINQEVPNRVDTKVRSYYDTMSSDFELILAMITVVYILAGISIVTTMAAVYAGVSLDTRRRRKEMALRKLNGADRKIIAKIFLRTYIWILGVASVIALALCFMARDEILSLMMKEIKISSVWLPYSMSLIIIAAVTLFTIAWKIRDIMNADPVEYLKE